MDEIRYFETGEPARLNDKVLVKRLFFFKTEGIMVYVPGISPPHPEMEIEGLKYIGVQMPGASIYSVPVDPSTNELPANIRLIDRGEEHDNENCLSPDEELE